MVELDSSGSVSVAVRLGSSSVYLVFSVKHAVCAWTVGFFSLRFALRNLDLPVERWLDWAACDKIFHVFTHATSDVSQVDSKALSFQTKTTVELSAV